MGVEEEEDFETPRKRRKTESPPKEQSPCPSSSNMDEEEIKSLKAMSKKEEKNDNDDQDAENSSSQSDNVDNANQLDKQKWQKGKSHIVFQVVKNIESIFNI